jgi:hypothetical protein
VIFVIFVTFVFFVAATAGTSQSLWVLCTDSEEIAEHAKTAEPNGSFSACHGSS